MFQFQTGAIKRESLLEKAVQHSTFQFQAILNIHFTVFQIHLLWHMNAHQRLESRKR